MFVAAISLISSCPGTVQERAMTTATATATATTTTATTKVSTFLSLPTPPAHKPQVALNKQVIYINKLPTLSTSHARTYSLRFGTFPRFASTSSTSTVEEEEEEDQERENDSASPSDDELLLQPEPSALNRTSQNLSSARGCVVCGREEIEKGCNGEGRIQGGIATVPGFGWWPIKAYRPCPAYLATGGRYKRRGQSMDEVASGGMRRGASAANGSEGESSKKKKGQRKFKR